MATEHLISQLAVSDQRGFIERNRAFVDFGIAVFVFGVLYKATLFNQIISSPFPPLGIRPDRFESLSHKGALVRYLDSEALFAISAALIAWLSSRIYESVRPARTVQSRTIWLFALMLVIGISYGLHYRLIFSMNIGLSYDVVAANINGLSLSDIWENLTLKDVVIFIVAPLVIFAFMRKLQRSNHSHVAVLVLASIAIVATTAAFSKNRLAKPIVTQNPVAYLLSTMAHTSHWEAEGEVEPAEAQLQSVRFADRMFSDELLLNTSADGQESANSKDWNILLVVLESVGREYVFSVSGSDIVPMPFLNRISQEGWYLQNHYSTANSSHRSTFSIFSGMYEMPSRSAFSLRGDLHIPSLNKFIDDDYVSFIVTPANEGSFFPLRFLRNNGLTDIMGFDAFPDIQPASPRHRNELEVMDRFLDRLGASSKPFFGSYFTFVGHAPYYDYGSEFAIFEDTSIPLNRYYNNLRLLDTLIERMFAKLEETGLLDSTIVVIVGDHGEAFGKHENVLVHASSNYNEEFLVPALIYQPRLFEARAIDEVTSHVDILPTLLDAIDIPYNRNLFQGESLFQRDLQRKYVFMINHGGGISSVSKEHIKVSFSANDGSCESFDLKNDPDETNAIACAVYQDQYVALRTFVSLQRKVLPAYNAAAKHGADFYENSHPGLR